MKTVFEKKLPVLLFALISASTLVSFPIAKSTWTSVKVVYGEQDFGLGVLREAMLVTLKSGRGAQKPVGLDAKLSGNARLVWKTSESSLSACCKRRGSDKG
ncbi:MAG: hypothetical protein WCP96_08545 [Methylococcaceae bacterium]